MEFFLIRDLNACNDGSFQNPENNIISGSLGNFFVFLCFEVEISMKSFFSCRFITVCL